MKHPVYSRTIQGIVVMALPIVTNALGVDLGDDEATKMAEAIVGLVGAIWAVYGRIAATERLTIRKTP